MIDRFWVDDDLKWGKLVKSWATGKNYFDINRPAPPLPRTLEDLKQQCADNGITAKIPDVHTGLTVVQSSKEILMIKLPSKALVEVTELEFAQGATYPFPKFYDDFYGTYGSPLVLPDTQKKLDFHACRIGDYSIRMCA
jgi:hypothetical protein